MEIMIFFCFLFATSKNVTPKKIEKLKNKLEKLDKNKQNRINNK